MRFHDYAQQSLARRVLRVGTLEDYHRLLRHADGTLGRLEVGRVRRAHVQQCLADARHAGLGDKSVRNLLSLVNSVLQEAGNTAATGLRVRAPEPALHVLTGGQARRLDAHLAELDTLEATALRVLMGTGLRRGELLALEVADWLGEQGQVHVNKSVGGPTKSGRGRCVDVPECLVSQVFAAVAQAREAGRRQLFPVHPRTLGRVLRRATEALELPPIRVHDLRHTRITQLLLAGVPALYVSDQAGHHSPGFTMARYGHLVTASQVQRREWANAAG